MGQSGADWLCRQPALMTMSEIARETLDGILKALMVSPAFVPMQRHVVRLPKQGWVRACKSLDGGAAIGEIGRRQPQLQVLRTVLDRQ
jgi:hypothetical protein